MIKSTSKSPKRFLFSTTSGRCSILILFFIPPQESKGNQKELYQQMISLLSLNLPTHTDTHIWEQSEHGRVEKRTATLLTDLTLLDQKED
jgi:hypothetical protein